MNLNRQWSPRFTIAFLGVLLIACSTGCMSTREFEEAARQVLGKDSGRPLLGAWQGTWRYSPDSAVLGRARAIFSSTEPTDSACHWRLGAHDYFVQMESVDASFPLGGGSSYQTFVLRFGDQSEKSALLGGKGILGPGSGEGWYDVYACASDDKVTLTYWSPGFRAKYAYILELTRFVSNAPSHKP